MPTFFVLLVLFVLLAAGTETALAENDEQMTVDLAQADPLGPHRESVDRAISYLLDHQKSDGCLHTQWGAAPAATAWTAILLQAAGGDPNKAPHSLVDGLAACGPPSGGEGEHASMNHVAALSRQILALAAVGEDPHGFDGRNWVQELRSHHNGLSFQDDDHPMAINDDAFAIIALRAAGAPPHDPNISSSADHLRLAQNPDGGWGITAGSESNTDATAAVLQALLRAQRIHREHDATLRAIDHLKDQSDEESGCLRGGTGHGANPDSTAWAVMALLAVHEDPRAAPWTSDGPGSGPWGCLLGRQMESGGFAPGMRATTPSLGTTTQAALALALTPQWTASDRSSKGLLLNVTGSPHPEETLVLRTDAAHVQTTSWMLPGDQIKKLHEVDWTSDATGVFAFEVLLLLPDTPPHLVVWKLEIEEQPETHDHPKPPQENSTEDPPKRDEGPKAEKEDPASTSDASDPVKMQEDPEPGQLQELPLSAAAVWLALGSLVLVFMRSRRL